MKPEHVTLQMNEDDRGRSGETEGLPSSDRLRADVALRIVIGRAAKFRAIVGQSPQPSVRQSFADPGAYFGAGQHGGAENSTPAEIYSLR